MRTIQLISCVHETWALAKPFAISRGTKTEADVVCVAISDGTHKGRGECVPYARYGETIAGVMSQIDTLNEHALASRDSLIQCLPPGAARNALDCALWDLEAKAFGRGVGDALGLGPVHDVETAITLSLDTPEAMAREAAGLSDVSILKLKLGTDADEGRMRAVRAVRPKARLLCDANEAWSAGLLKARLQTALEANIELIEQPLPAEDDDALVEVRGLVDGRIAICADESLHTRAGLPRLAVKYDAVNVKLDKTGGLTEALETAHAAREAGLRVMVGSMVATSLSMAPAWYLAQHADWADLDSPLLLARDRDHAMRIAGGRLSAPSQALWG